MVRESKHLKNPLGLSVGREWLASGLAICALGLLAGFIAVPILSLIVWTVNEEAWAAMASPVAREALYLSMRTTAGIALLLAFGRLGLVGEYLNAFGITLSFTTVAVVMAEVFVAAPFYLRQAATGFAEVDRATEEAALVDGADRASAFLRVTVPLAFPALVAGAVTAWARALGEFGATIIFAGNLRGITQTVPLAIYAALESDFNAAVALSVLVLGFAFTIILTVRYLTRKVTEYQN